MGGESEAGPSNEPLFDGPHPDHPVLSAAVQVKYDEYQGRHLVAARRIPVGALVLRERAFTVTVRRNEMARDLCQTCVRYLHRDSQRFDEPKVSYGCVEMPDGLSFLCADCEDPYYQFCSAECREQAQRTFHIYQCGYTHIHNAECKTLEQEFWRLVRVLVRVRPAEFVATDPERADIRAEYGKLGSAAVDTPFRSQDYRSIMSLVGHLKRGSGEALRVWQRIEASVDRVLEHVTLKGFFDSQQWQQTGLSRDEQHALVRRHLKALIPRYASNNFSLLSPAAIKNEEHDESTSNQTRPSAMFTVASLVNHSCHRNLFHMFDGDVVMFRAVRPIEPGQPIVTNYGAYFGLYETRAMRRQHMASDYDFVCQCPACLDNSTFIKLEQQMCALRCPECDGPSCLPAEDYEYSTGQWQLQGGTPDDPPTLSDMLDVIKPTADKPVITTCHNCQHRLVWTDELLLRVRHLADEEEQAFHRKHTTTIEHCALLLTHIERVFFEHARINCMLREKIVDMCIRQRQFVSELLPEHVARLQRTASYYHGDDSIEAEMVLRCKLKVCWHFRSQLPDIDFDSVLDEWCALAWLLYGADHSRQMIRISAGIDCMDYYDKHVNKNT